MNFCTVCGGGLSFRTLDGDDRPRYICDACGAIHYENPKIVVGTIPRYRGRILLCRRAIEPRRGLWTLPAGFMENNETVEQGAVRETLEEAGAEVKNLQPFGLFDLPFVSQVYLMFLADLPAGRFSAGHESLEARLFKEEEIPWDAISFSVIEKTLRLYLADRQSGRFGFHTGIVNRRMGDAGGPEES